MKKLILFFSFIGLTLITNAQCSVIFNFDSISGSNPQSSLIYDGVFLYGMTYSGGESDPNYPSVGNGTVFKIKPDGSNFEKLLDFAKKVDSNILTLDSLGSFPWGSLILEDNFLYGMTSGGGTHHDGTIFKIRTDGTDNVKLHNFESINGDFPKSDLVSDGIFLYGMTVQGGAHNAGIIFKIKKDGSNFIKLMDFDISNGNNPHGSLIYDGTYLYGLVYGGGVNYYGSIFKILTDGSGYEDLWDFDEINGKLPLGSLIFDGTYLFGVTACGGANLDNSGGYGTIFKIKPDGSDFEKIMDFDSTKGKNPVGSLLFDGVYLYGMTENGGIYDFGTAFKIKPDGSGFEKIFDFDSINGSWPMNGSFISDGTFLYGMTYRGGIYDKGVIFKLTIPVENCSAQFNLVPDTTDPHHYFAINNSSGVHPLTYFWSWGDGSFDSIAYPSHIYSTAGTYTICLTITDSTGCTIEYCDSSNLQKSTNSIIYINVIPPASSSINKINSDNSFLVYPNPAINSLTIESENKSTLEILSIQGQTILQQILPKEKISIDISGLAKGIYILRLKCNDKTEVTKFIKE